MKQNCGIKRIGNKLMKKLLHIGCGFKRQDLLPDIFKDYEEIRQDIDKNVNPDYCCSINDMSIIESDQFDAVFSSHCLEHLHPFDILPTLEETNRVLNGNGFVFIRVPDLEIVAEFILKGMINTTVYESDGGPVAPLDMIYGFKYYTKKNPFMEHKCGFTVNSLIDALRAARFGQVTGRRYGFDVQAIAAKTEQINLQEILERI